MNTYTLINYFDVWGNEVDGYEVNNQCVEAKDIVIADDATDKEVLNKLVEMGFLNTSDMRRLVVENDWNCGIEILEKKGMKPLYGLRRKS